jgi:hypothetical protein
MYLLSVPLFGAQRLTTRSELNDLCASVIAGYSVVVTYDRALGPPK